MMTDRAGPLEIALSAAWHSGHFGSELQTIEEGAVQVIHRGSWSHGKGPDFQDALVLFDDRELRAGSIEIHLRSRNWTDHGHHLDPAYNTVVLHVVGRHDGVAARREDGGVVPTVQIGPIDDLEVPDLANWEWDRVGGKVCASRAAVTRPQAVREILFRLGDIRIAARSARIEARLQSEPPGEILWQELLDGLGFAANREPMRAVARLVTIASLETRLEATPTNDRMAVARGILLGAAGFLPLSPTESHLGRLAADDVSRLETRWQEMGTPWRSETIPPATWDRARARPANHPVARLLAAASIVASASHRGGLLSTILNIALDNDDPIAPFRALTANGNLASIGQDRAVDILASGVLPFALALAAHSGDQALADAAASHWERLPAAAANAVTRRAAQQVAGATPLGKIGARGAQGLIHLDTVLCQPRRCFECPIAAAELSVNG